MIIPNFAKEEFTDEKKVTLVLWDSACSDDYNEIRTRGYAGADFFLLCFAMNDPRSLEHAYSVWMKEAQPIAPEAKIILVATKYDVKTMADKEIAPTRNRIKPRYYIETSSVTGENVFQLFKTIALLTVDPEQVPEPICEEEQKEEEKKPRAAENPKSKTCILI